MKQIKTIFAKSTDKRYSEFQKGFTLLELLMVVVIVGTLASLLIPRLTGHREKMEAVEAINILSVIRKGLLRYYDESNNVSPYPSIGSQCSSSTTTNSYRELGLDIPTTGCPNPKWTYQAYTGCTDFTLGGPSCKLNSGSALALRLLPASAKGLLVLRADGSWCATDSYAAGQKYDMSSQLPNYSTSATPCPGP